MCPSWILTTIFQFSQDFLMFLQLLEIMIFKFSSGKKMWRSFPCYIVYRLDTLFRSFLLFLSFMNFNKYFLGWHYYWIIHRQILSYFINIQHFSPYLTFLQIFCKYIAHIVKLWKNLHELRRKNAFFKNESTHTCTCLRLWKNAGKKHNKDSKSGEAMINSSWF